MFRFQEAKHNGVRTFEPLTHHALALEPQRFEHFDSSCVVRSSFHGDASHSIKTVTNDVAEIPDAPGTANRHCQFDIFAGPVIIDDDSAIWLAIALNEKTDKGLSNTDAKTVYNVLSGRLVILPNQD